MVRAYTYTGQHELLVPLQSPVFHYFSATASPATLLQACLQTHQMCASAALATEDPSPDLLLETPHGRTEPLINGAMWTHINVQGIYQVTLSLPCLLVVLSCQAGYTGLSCLQCSGA